MTAPGTGRWQRARATLGLAWRADPATVRWLVAVTAALALLPLGIATTGKLIVDAVAAQDANRALVLVGVELGLVAALGLLGRAGGYLHAVLGARLALSVTVSILQKAQALRLQDFEDPEMNDRLTRARREATTRPVEMAGELFAIVRSVVTLSGFVGLLLVFSPLAVVVLAAAALPATAGEIRFSRAFFDLRQDRTTDGRRLAYLERVLCSADHAKEVKLLGLGPLLVGRYEALAGRILREDAGLARRRALYGGLLALLGNAAFYGCLMRVAWLAATGALSLGDLTLYGIAFQQAQSAFQAALLGLGSLYEHDLYMSNLFAFLGHEVPQNVPPPAAPARNERGLRFEGVGFRYPGRDEWAVRGLDLFVPAGQRFALVGVNGSGKSTLIRLATGLAEPTEGRVLLDGQDLRTLPPGTLHARLSVAFQDYVRYQASARENVAFGDVARLDDPERLERAVAAAGAQPVIDALPSGAESVLGRWFPGGVDLSGGQWQRIAVARALYREGADWLILDEPTAALDAEGERALFEAALDAAAGRAVILISHRFPAVRRADRIGVLEAGRLVEDGTHAALIAKGGRYAELFALQAEGYLPD